MLISWGDASAELSERGELLRLHELGLRVFELTRALVDAGFELTVPGGDFVAAFAELGDHGVEVFAEAAHLDGAGDVYMRRELAFADATSRGRQSLQRRRQPAREQEGQTHRKQDRAERRAQRHHPHAPRLGERQAGVFFDDDGPREPADRLVAR